MKTFKPTWNWKSRALIVISVFFLILFSIATAFLMFFSIRQLNNGIDTNSLAAIILSLAMLFAAVFWSIGMLDLKSATYSLSFDRGMMIWSERSARGSSERTIPINRISGFGAQGIHNTGLSLLVRTSDKSHRLGSLLSSETLNQIITLIAEQKQQAEQGGDGDAEEAV